MKSVTFARLALFSPYAILTESIIYFSYHDLEANAKGFQLFNFYWNFFAIFWAIPYTILTLYLLIWSRGKTKEDIQSLYTLAPILMIFISLGVYIIVAIIGYASTKDFYSLWPILFLAGIGSISGDLIVDICSLACPSQYINSFKKSRSFKTKHQPNATTPLHLGLSIQP